AVCWGRRPPRDVGRDAGRPPRHRFPGHGRQTVAIAVGRDDAGGGEYRGAAHEGDDFATRARTHQVYVVLQLTLQNQRRERRFERPGTDDVALERGTAALQQGAGFHQNGETFLLDEATL